MEEKNISSGAEKAEKLAKNNGAQKKCANTKGKAQCKKGGKSAAVKSKAQTKTKTQNAVKDEKKQQRLQHKLELKQQRLQRLTAYKERMQERKEKRRERRELLAHETKEQRAERKLEERRLKTEAAQAKRKAHMEERKAKREHDLRMKQERRQNRTERKRAPGFGGWLAAVIALGVTTLALGTVVGVGATRIETMQAGMMGRQTETLYELNSVVDNMDENLSKARIATSSTEQAQLLSDVAVESEMAEVLIERLPAECNCTAGVTDFVNHVSQDSRQMLIRLASGKKLTSEQVANIEKMYQTNQNLKQALNELTTTCTGKQLLLAMQGKNADFAKTFETFAKNVENYKTGKTPAKAKVVAALPEITAPEAEKLAEKYFADYGVKKVTCTGEAGTKGLPLYNLTLSTEQGELFAQLSKQGGKVVLFDSYRPCEDKNFNVERCIDIAEEFLQKLGYEDVSAVWTSENGATCNLSFAYVQNDVVVYPDLIKVKVCEQCGVVTGIEAAKYIQNHTERELVRPAISTQKATGAIRQDVEVQNTRLAVIPVRGTEVLCYEIMGEYGDAQYYIYVSAATGEQVETRVVIGTKQGKVLS